MKEARRMDCSSCSSCVLTITIREFGGFHSWTFFASTILALIASTIAVYMAGAGLFYPTSLSGASSRSKSTLLGEVWVPAVAILLTIFFGYCCCFFFKEAISASNSVLRDCFIMSNTIWGIVLVSASAFYKSAIASSRAARSALTTR